MFDRQFWKDAAERAVKTFAQTLAATLTVDAITSTELLVPALVASGLAALLSVLTSVGSSRIGDDSPSLVAPVSLSPIDGDPDGVARNPDLDEEAAQAGLNDA